MLSVFDDDEYNEYDAEDYDETDYDELDYEEDDNDAESLFDDWNNKSNKMRSKMTNHHNKTGCCCIALLVPIIVLVFAITIFAFSIKSYSYTNYDPVKEAYKGGEPDYADGDLEDKLGDSGYYYDLFPEERDDEPDDYKPSYKSNNKYKSNFNVDENFIRNMKDISTRQYKVYGAIVVNNKVYYKNADGSFHSGWKEELGKWYYFDPTTFALVMNELRDINGIVYYFKKNGVMACNETFLISGISLYADKNGSCSIVNNN